MDIKRGANLPPWVLPVSAGLGAALLSAIGMVWLAGDPGAETAGSARPAPSHPTLTAAPAQMQALGAAAEPETPATAAFKLQAHSDLGSIPLMFGAFPSAVDLVSMRIALEQQGYEPAESAQHRTLPAGAPPFELDTMRITGYKHLEQPGVLTLSFFNNQLYEVEFEPEDAAAYRAAIQPRLPGMKRGRTGRAERTQGRLRVSSSLDLAVSEVGKSLKTRPYVLWQDLRVVAERDNWDRKYGSQSPAASD